MKFSLALIFIIGLTSCGGGEGDSNNSNPVISQAQCDSITGGASMVTSTCSGCTVEFENLAADGDLSTPASAYMDTEAVSATYNIRATAQSGVVYPAGSQAGVFFTLQGGVCNNCTAVVRTLLQGQVQESQVATNNTTTDGTSASQLTVISTTMPFDAVEIEDTRSVSPSTEPLVRVYEICSEASYDG